MHFIKLRMLHRCSATRLILYGHDQHHLCASLWYCHTGLIYYFMYVIHIWYSYWLSHESQCKPAEYVQASQISALPLNSLPYSTLRHGRLRADSWFANFVTMSLQAGQQKFFWHLPELGSLLYSLYKIPLTQACFPLAWPNFHSYWRAGEC